MDRKIWDDMMTSGHFYYELDWLAVDNKRQLGIFTALMNAPVPDKVKSSFENYQDLRQRIESALKITSAVVVTHQEGNFNDWIEYASKGFFAFDFHDVHRTEKKNQYDLIARPAKPLTVDELRLPSVLAASIVRIDCDFADGDLLTEKLKNAL